MGSVHGTRKRSVEDFDLIRIIGNGAFGKVWLVKLRESGEFYAMKIVDKQSVIEQNLIEHTIAERDIMLMCNHPFIITLYWTFQTEKKLYFILDYVAGGSLFTHLCNSADTYLSLEDTLFYASEIVLGLQELHSKHIVYRDLKPENILISQDGHLLLTDFGLSHHLGSSTGKVHSFSGTALYISPEVLLDKEHDKCVDWWSFGVMLHLLLTGIPPFWSKNRKELFEMIKEGEININNHLLTPEAKDLIEKLLERDASKRLGAKRGADEIKEHPFFKDINWKDVLEKNVEPPFIPVIKDNDLNESEGTRIKINQKGKKNRHCRNKSHEVFEGFSFVAPQDENNLLKPPTKGFSDFNSDRVKKKRIKEKQLKNTDEYNQPQKKKKRTHGHRRAQSYDVRAQGEFCDSPPSPKDNSPVIERKKTKAKFSVSGNFARMLSKQS